jgi:tRNA nucleotidyltransferase (CCA-adding enzyme)
MEIIVSHNNTDFDGLASMVAAKKLYPEAELVFVGKLCRNVEDFMGLHKDTFRVHMAKDIPQERVDKLILVDTKTQNRLGHLKKLASKTGITIHIYDHHPRTEQDVVGTLEVVETLGATTTLLVELIQEAGLAINSFEATILALGVYEDTGCLTFSTTTSRDAAAIAFLLEHGANLKIIADFIGRPLTEPQKNLLNTLILSAQHFLIHGTKVLVAKSTVDEYIGGLALLTHKLGEIESVDIIMAVVEMEDRVHIVARSRVDHVSVSDILEAFGGGGHDKAASATIKDIHVDEVQRRLLQVLQERIKPEISVAQLMTAPVKTVFPETSIDEAGKIMLRYGHSGLPVVNPNLDIVGIISRRDVDKAKHHGLGHAPVKGYMSRRVVSVTPDVPLPEIQRLLIDNHIGRLPVVENGRLLGIVSRTDVLRTLHGASYPETYQKIYLPDGERQKQDGKVLTELMLERLPEKIRDILGKICYLSFHKNYQVYVVGGFVRDLLLNVENFDIDLVVEGDGISFARLLAEFFCGRVKIHEKIGTAIVVLPDGYKIDVATARTEFYEYPAALPMVENSTLKEDLYRRDFTINAMALDLTKDNFGELVDHFGARRDLERQVVRILYTLSFVEDPTRIFRAIRFEQRYDFTMEPQTLELAKKAIKDNWLQKLSYDRIREELRHIFNEQNPIKAISRMRELGLWKTIMPEIAFNDEIRRVVDNLPLANNLVAKEIDNPHGLHPWLTYFTAMVHQLDNATVEEICQRFKLTNDDQRIIKESVLSWEAALKILDTEEEVTLSTVSRTIGEQSEEACAFILAKAQNLRVWELVQKYLNRVKVSKLEIDGNDLKNIGCPKGPLYGQILQRVWEAKLDNMDMGKEAELRLAGKLLKQVLEDGQDLVEGAG